MLALTQEDKSLSLPFSGRDPLGTMPIWQHRARDVVPNLTAASRNAAGFHVLLIALAWWPGFAIRHKRPATDIRKFFVLVEQAFARACHCCDVQWDLPGSQRLNAGEDGVYISLRPEYHLLESQLANGVWGLYRGPAESAGLIDAGNRIQSSEVLRMVTARFGKAAQVLVNIERAIAAEQSVETIAQRRTNGLAHTLASEVASLPLKRLVRETFVTPSAAAITTKFARLAKSLPRDCSTQDLVRMSLAAYPEHSDTIKDIQKCESFIAPLDSIFQYICSAETIQLSKLTSNLPINLSALASAKRDFEKSGRYEGLAKARVDLLLRVSVESKAKLVASVIEHHQRISDSRKNAAWVALGDGGQLEIRVPTVAPDKTQLAPATAWQNNYYLDALQALAFQVGTGSA